MDEWKRIVTHLREQCPIRRHRLVVKRIKYKGTDPHGVTHVCPNDRTITICVNTRQNWSSQVHTLIHEWGHAMWYDEVNWHDDRWGELHSQAYRAWEKME